MTPSQLDQISRGLCAYGRCPSAPESPSKYCRPHIDARTAASVRAQERKKRPQDPCARCKEERPAAIPGTVGKLCQKCAASIVSRRNGWPNRRSP